MPPFLKKKEFWGTLIALAILLYLVKDIRPADIERLVKRVDLHFLIPALLMQFVVVVLKAVRWRIIIEKTKRLSYLRVIPLFSAGQVLNIIMPALTGQVGRLLLFARKVGLSKTYVFSTLVLEVLFDAISLLVLILLLSTGFVFPAEYRSVSYIIAIATISLFVILYLSLTFKDQIGSVGRRALRSRWPGVYITLKKFSKSFTKGIALLRSTHYFTRTLILSLLTWGAHVLVAHFLFKSFGFPLPFMAAAVIMVVNTLALMVPITPGNAGTFELAIMAPLLAFKIAKSDAVLYAMALHVLDLIPVFIMGLMFFHTERMTIKELREEGEKEEILDQVEEDILVKEEKP